MRFRHLAAAVAAGALAAQATPVTTQKSTLPQGRPFQTLQHEIDTVEQSLRREVADLEARLDAQTSDLEAQARLLGALQALVGQVETRLASQQASVEELQSYMTLQDAMLQRQSDHLGQLQAAAESQTGNLTMLFTLFTGQQAAVAALQHSIEFIESQSSADQSQLASLYSQLTSLTAQYQATRAALQSGCAPGSAIRQVLGVVAECEPVDVEMSVLEITGPSPGLIAAGATVTRDAACPASTPPLYATGGGYVASDTAEVVSSSRLGNGWRIVARNPHAFPITVTAKVICLRVR